MFLCSIYVQKLQQAAYVFCKFCVLCCLALFTFIFNIFVTNESMYIVMMIEKKTVYRLFYDVETFSALTFLRCRDY